MVKNPKKMIEQKIEMMRNFSNKNQCLEKLILRCLVHDLVTRGKCYPEYWSLNLDRELVFRSNLSGVCDFLKIHGIDFEIGREASVAQGDTHNGRYVKLVGEVYDAVIKHQEYLNYRISQMVEFFREN